MQKMNYVKVEGNERALLNIFLAHMRKLDPDLLVGHELKENQLITLTNRLATTKAALWSCMSRLRRTRDAPRASVSRV